MNRLNLKEIWVKVYRCSLEFMVIVVDFTVHNSYYDKTQITQEKADLQCSN